MGAEMARRGNLKKCCFSKLSTIEGLWFTTVPHSTSLKIENGVTNPKEDINMRHRDAHAAALVFDSS
jgi:hypothetical protein